MNQAQNISPSSLSPVLKQELTVQLIPGFPTITDLSQYSAYIMGMTDKTYRRNIYIMGYDDALKQMTVKFNGAPSGMYRLFIEGPDGRVGGPPLLLTTVIGVDSISPLQGSVLGGTLLTINGAHFGEEATDNPVKVGDHYCLIEDTSDSEIKCRITLD